MKKEIKEIKKSTNQFQEDILKDDSFFANKYIKYNSNFLFRLPKTLGSKNKFERYNVFIIDSSGSMEDDWKNMSIGLNKIRDEYPDTLFITFSDNAEIVNRKFSEDIRKHNSGGTSMDTGFRLALEEMEKKFKKNKNIF